MDIVLWLATGIAIGLLLAVLRRRFLSFEAQSPHEYDGLGPVFDLREHLDGPIICEGVIFGPMGRVASRFVARMEGKWDGDTGVLEENFQYDSGTAEYREWRLVLGEDGHFRAEADDVPGHGVGRALGPAVSLSYPIVLPPESGGHKLQATDWMYLMENGTIINRSQFRKFGFKVAELVAVMRKEAAG